MASDWSRSYDCVAPRWLSVGGVTAAAGPVSSSLYTRAGVCPSPLPLSGTPGSGVGCLSSELGVVSPQATTAPSSAPPELLSPLALPSPLPLPLPDPTWPPSCPPWAMSRCGDWERVVGKGGSCMGNRASPLPGADATLAGLKSATSYSGQGVEAR